MPADLQLHQHRCRRCGYAVVKVDAKESKVRLVTVVVVQEHNAFVEEAASSEVESSVVSLAVVNYKTNARITTEFERDDVQPRSESVPLAAGRWPGQTEIPKLI